MARSKKNSSGMNQVQGSLVEAVDHVVTGMEHQIVEHAEQRLFDFVLGGGLANQLAVRMLPHLEEFKSQVGAAVMPSAPVGSLALGGSIDVDAEVDDV